MFFKTLTLVLSLASAVTAYPGVKRESETQTGIYAYGSHISGLTVYGGPDGKAYITEANSTNTNLEELIWDTPTAEGKWNVTTVNRNLSDFSSVANFYIVSTEGAFEDCGFRRPNETAPAGATETGFRKFGKQIIWSDSTNYVSLFWAEATETEGLYKLKWNDAGEAKNNSVSVALKTTPPPTR